MYMVKNLDEKYNLNHIYRLPISATAIAVSSSSSTNTAELELFQKSLALTSDLERLPILRGIAGCFRPNATLPVDMGGSGVANCTVTVFLYNDDEDSQDSDELLGTWEFILSHTTNVITGVAVDDITWDFEGGVLLNDKISVKLTFATSTAVATTALGFGAVDIYLEVDWVKLTDSEFNQYIKEHIYAKMD